jgi:hypothetical protein
MSNGLRTEILIQSPSPRDAAQFYVEQLGFAIAGDTAETISLHGHHISRFIERGPAPGPMLEVAVAIVAETRERLTRDGCMIVKDDPHLPRCYVIDPFGPIYNLTE